MSAQPHGATCGNCGTTVLGAYCHACGQKAEHALPSFRQFLTSSLGDLFHLESRLLRTLSTLLLAPGALTSAFVHGRRVRYIQPLQLYLLAASFFFIVGTYRPIVQFDTATRQVRSSLNAVKAGGEVSEQHLAELAARGISIDLFAERFRAGVNRHLPTFLIGSLLLFSFGLAVAYYRSRRRYLEHAIFALHWSAFYLLLMSLGLLVPRLPGPWDLARIVELAFFAIAWAYLFRALRNVYDQGLLPALAKATLLFLWFNVLLALWVTSVIVWAIETI